jgi:hypothetical protein
MKMQDLIGKEFSVVDVDRDGILLEDHSQGRGGIANATYVRVSIMANGEAELVIEELVGKKVKA